MDNATGPFHGNDTASVCVETLPVRQSILVLDIAAGIVRLAGSVDFTVRGCQSAGKSTIIHDGATFRSMQGQSVVRVVIDAFDNVNFAAVGPFGSNSKHPECWPKISQILADALVSIKATVHGGTCQVPQIPPGM